MSIVLSYADEHIAIIASDGRVTNAINNTILSETYKKVKAVNVNVIIGYAGAVIVCDYIANMITDSKSTTLTQDSRVEDVVVLIEKLLSAFPSGLHVGFIVCGIGKNKKMCTAIISMNQKTQIYYPDNSSPFYCALYPNDIPRDTQIYESLL